jgi:16S rRNA (guanine(527)-N(7))-methyltransferase RsmG
VFAELLRERMGGVCTLSPEQVGLLQKHYELLVKWNKALNLTSVRSEEEIVERHYCESLFLGVYLPLRPLAIADIGSGAGFPGFPVAVLRPDCTVTLIESHQRKSVFLKESSRYLQNVRVSAKRAEDIGERFDWAISRAVRYEDIQEALGKLASNVIILTGDVQRSELSGFNWCEPIRLPWGDRRFLVVSRETVDSK